MPDPAAAGAINAQRTPAQVASNTLRPANVANARKYLHSNKFHFFLKRNDKSNQSVLQDIFIAKPGNLSANSITNKDRKLVMRLFKSIQTTKKIR